MTPTTMRRITGPEAVIGVPLALVSGASVVQPGATARYGAVIVFVLALVSLGSRSRIGRTDWWALALAGWASASVFWSVSPLITEETLKDFVGFAVIFVGLRFAVSSLAQLRLVALGYVTGCVYAVYLLRQSAAVVSGVDRGLARSSIDGVNANYLAYSVALSAVIVLLVWRIRRPGLLGRMVLSLLVVATVWVGLEATGTRGAWLGLMLLAAWLVGFRLRPRLALAFLLLGTLVIQLVILSGVADGWIDRSVQRSAREAGGLNGRLGNWRQARQAFLDDFIGGSGADSFLSRSATGVAAHNVILDLGTGLGIVGVILFVGVLVRALHTDSPHVPMREKWWVSGSFLAVTVPLLSSGYWHTSPAFWVGAALVSRYLSLLESERQPRRDCEDAETASPGVVGRR